VLFWAPMALPAALTLAFSLLLSLAGLVLLWGLLSAAFHLYLLLMVRLSESCRDALSSDRILEAARQRQQTLQRRQRQALGWSLVDLDGRRRWLEASQLEPFARRCRQELELPAPCGLAELRRHWRRGSLRWHPDRGGDPQAWLRRLRAYEALCQLSGDRRASLLLRPVSQALPAVRRRRLLLRWRR
jgi:hypothetical protein